MHSRLLTWQTDKGRTLKRARESRPSPLHPLFQKRIKSLPERYYWCQVPPRKVLLELPNSFSCLPRCTRSSEKSDSTRLPLFKIVVRFLLNPRSRERSAWTRRATALFKEALRNALLLCSRPSSASHIPFSRERRSHHNRSSSVGLVAIRLGFRA
jgi:hypothetical protein